MIPRFLVRVLTGYTQEFVSPSSIHSLKTSNHLSPQYSLGFLTFWEKMSIPSIVVVGYLHFGVY
jgi:hypothetical protein